MKFYTEEEILDQHIGQKGSAERENFDLEVNAFLIGEVIKKARLSKNLTQEQLGELIGVQKAQVSKIENGKNLTMATVSKVFKAMNIKVKLEIGNIGQVALW